MEVPLAGDPEGFINTGMLLPIQGVEPVPCGKFLQQEL